MKLIVDKLGRVDHAEIEIKPLTVFVGENNTNKTWAAYSLYGLARRQARNPDITAGFAADDTPVGRLEDAVAVSVDRAAREAREAVARVDEERAVTLELRRGAVLGDAARVAFVMDENDLGRVLAVPTRAIPDARARLILERTEIETDDLDALVITADQKHKSIEAAWRGKKGHTLSKDNLTVIGEASASQLAADVEDFVRRRIVQTHRTVLALPAERKLIASIFSRQRSQDLQKLSLPVRHYNDFLAVAGYSIGTGLPSATEALERLLGGQVAFENGGRNSLVYRFGTGGELPIQGAASLVRALAGLDMYIRAWAEPGDLLIIDEPEMNAHPDAQLRITELLAYLVKQGIRVVLTTHSPYVLDHLATLVEASRLQGDARAGIVQKLRLKSDEALLEPEQLGVYRFDLDGKVTSIFDPETRSIDPSTFSDVGDAETNLFSDVLAAGRRGD